MKNFRKTTNTLKLLLILAIDLFFYGCNAKDNTMNDYAKTLSGNEKRTGIIVLSKNNTEVKILPSIGGTIVYFGKTNGKNILKSDTSLWNYKFDVPVKDRIYNNIIPINGHTIWLGTQTDWWKNQNVRKDLREKQAAWPPDPFLIYGEYNVLKLTESYAVLESEPSIYTGVKLIKKIRVIKDGRAVIIAEAINVTDKPISWDVWFNTRVDGYAKIYVPIAKRENVRIQYKFENQFEKMPYKIEKGFFTFVTSPPSSGFPKRHGKALIYPRTNKMFAFTNDKMFVIAFKKYNRSKVHKEHGMVEIYNSVDANGDALSEMEYHAPYETILPEKSISGKEVWEIVDYRNGNDFNSHINFINAYLSLKREEI